MNELDDREKALFGTAMLACCALHPNCTGKGECKALEDKLKIGNKGVIALSPWVFEHAKRMYLESLTGFPQSKTFTSDYDIVQHINDECKTWDNEVHERRISSDWKQEDLSYACGKAQAYGNVLSWFVSDKPHGYGIAYPNGTVINGSITVTKDARDKALERLESMEHIIRGKLKKVKIIVIEEGW